MKELQLATGGDATSLGRVDRPVQCTVQGGTTETRAGPDDSSRLDGTGSGRLFSKHQPSGPMLSISRNVHMCVCVSVCLSVCSLLRYRLTVFLPPLPEVRCPIFLEIWNPWGKVMERTFLFGSGLK